MPKPTRNAPHASTTATAMMPTPEASLQAKPTDEEKRQGRINATIAADASRISAGTPKTTACISSIRANGVSNFIIGLTPLNPEGIQDGDSDDSMGQFFHPLRTKTASRKTFTCCLTVSAAGNESRTGQPAQPACRMWSRPHRSSQARTQLNTALDRAYSGTRNDSPAKKAVTANQVLSKESAFRPSKPRIRAVREIKWP